MIIYAILMSIGSILGLILPETKGREVPDTIEEAENANKIELKILGNKNDKSWYLIIIIIIIISSSSC